MLIKLIDGKWVTPIDTRVAIRLDAKDFAINFDFVEGLVLRVRSSVGVFQVQFNSDGYLEYIIQTNYGTTPEKDGTPHAVMQFDVELDKPWAIFFRQIFDVPEVGKSEQYIHDKYISTIFLNHISLDQMALVPKEWIEVSHA